MRVAVEKLEGVEGAEVSLNEGHAVITFESRNSLTIAELRATIRDQGFSPKAARVRVSGLLEEREGSLMLGLPGGGMRLRLAGPATTAFRGRVGETLVLEGVIGQDEGGVTPSVLLVGAGGEPS